MTLPESKINITNLKLMPDQEAFLLDKGIQWASQQINLISPYILPKQATPSFMNRNAHMTNIPAHMDQTAYNPSASVLEELQRANDRLLNALPRAPGVRDVAEYTQPDVWMTKRGVQMPAVYNRETVALAMKAMLKEHTEVHDHDMLHRLSSVMSDMLLSERSNNTRAAAMALDDITTGFRSAVNEVNLLKEGLKRLIASTETLKKELEASHSTNRQLRETNRQLQMRGSAVKPTRKIRR